MVLFGGYVRVSIIANTIGVEFFYFLFDNVLDWDFVCECISYPYWFLFVAFTYSHRNLIN